MSITLTDARNTGELPELGLSEQLVLCSDQSVGLQAAIAIDNTTLGPGLGGVRFTSYPDLWAGAREAQRLARGMTAKNALAGLPYGGAKSVIVADAATDSFSPEERAALMRRFGEFVARLGGTYLPGVDMGTTGEDMKAMTAAGADATCSDEDPSPWTALGVFEAIRSGARHALGATELDGVRVLVQGVGHVGHSLAKQLAEHGARVSVTDVDATRAQDVADSLGATAIDPAEVIAYDCDIFAPCATARVITAQNLPTLRCQVVAGAANDTLATDDLATALHEAGILYVPDFVANAGGVIHIHGLRMRWDHSLIRASVEEIGHRVDVLLEEAGESGLTPLEAAAVQRDRILARGMQRERALLP
ncbi:Glu/Leu/Phe/Val family dehydrogenase [Nocardioides sp. Kera G14]|uniref:Glu/Leu/Phe/Val family dehydrogenase n=1 Tax=Nocardioides sp. Kera G14 TaxID=2884264 RepID=UPI001D102465|nr:Glu/Leu/Phe/Val dehydrogenase dimerization domain-containing protein [Nocardioides sp. Kera G14]UDY23598.1 hypothetical protein LH076_16290 [Nocardioides sp. Kera G14]